MTHVGVPVQQTQIQLNLVTNPIPISQHLGWPQPITPLIARQLRITMYLMWYNSIPFFVHIDRNVYSMYYLGIKGFHP